MIKESIKNKFNNQFNSIEVFSENIYIADYTEITKSSPTKKGVEVFSPTPPNDINFFAISNQPKIEVASIKFDNSSFVYPNGNPKSQCEAVFFPNISQNNSWILFCELKYSSKQYNNRNNLKKAIKQLYKTRCYYMQKNVISLANTCYLIASLPLQSEPFSNFSLTPTLLIKLKTKRNVILRLKNSVDIENNKLIIV